MTLAKRLLLGTAAAFVATSGAHAADLGLPVAPSVDYVQICSIGSFTGFILPGGDVCFDISGYARGQYTWSEEIDPYAWGLPATVSAAAPVAATAAGAALTALGYNVANVNLATGATVTTTTNTTTPGFITLTAAGAALTGFSDGSATPIAANSTIAGLGVLAIAGNNDESDFTGNARINFDARTMTEYGLLRGFIRLDGENGNAANVDRAFVQLNVGSLGFTAGLADSVFDPVFTGYGSGTANGLGLADQASTQFSVNAAVGNGVTVSLSVEDDDARTGQILTLTNAAAAGAGVQNWTLGAGAYDGGQSIPDLVAAIRVDQAWGSAKLAAALHEVNPAGSAVGSEYGYALSASAEFNIPVGVGSTFGITGIYANGAQQFMGFNNSVGNSSTGYADAIVVTANSTAAPMLDLTTSYVLAAGFNFGLSDMVSLSLDGSYADVDHYGSLFDGNTYTIRGGVAYTPVNNLTINTHVSYTASDFNTDALRVGVDDDEWSARLRITRSF
jgi:hypothetical protein